jgi:predicted short-subunit dehydrogenase-like oxidoreductase (DUF2520 family)
MYSLGIIGGGRAAWAFGSAWRRIGWPISGVTLRGASEVPRLLDAPQRPVADLAADSDLLLIAVSDRAIHEVAGSVPVTRAIIWHPSGSLTSVRGGFSLHPLRALPPVGEPSDIRDTLLVFEGNHGEIAERIASALGARFAEIAPADKPRYHAAAVFASNYVAALLDIAHELNPVRDARDDLVALAQSAIENWRQHEDARRFTGPAARGDRDVIKAHVNLLQTQRPLALIYELLADRIIATRK